ncbi:inverse autotransporter beta-barrel domain-containing protein [Serratia marcescens]|nr:inverse autotransporter beta-barrel domain-containing protein [Serratia marcescens]
MLGVNSFYDYDYTGKNRRLGIGGEAWRDYIKLSANGYFRLTNWHQSVLSVMEDYDERPANGFDIRAEGYLPSWPYLGGNLKYEQYFGKGVSVADGTSPDSLKNSPTVLTAGLSYTPFPLMTISASRSVGDSNDTRMALDINYRLGVPWFEQLNPDNVDLMRSLAGNKYDFVDRNYNIVMQYRKQDLLRIELPDRREGQAAETIMVPLKVSKAKYGLKNVNWSVSPELVARGGHYRLMSPTEMQITLPAYVFTDDRATPQTYQVSAVATDNHDNHSNTTTMLIDVIPSRNVVGKLTLSPNDQVLPADGSTTYTATAMAMDKQGQPLAGQQITFRVDGLLDLKGNPGTRLSPARGGHSDPRKITTITGLDGSAALLLNSRIAGKGSLTATMINGNFNRIPVNFKGDATTAKIHSVILQGTEVSKVADGVHSFMYTAMVVDGNGNPVPDVAVSWSQNREHVVLSSVMSKTGADGRTSAMLTSTTSAVADVLVSAKLGDGAAVGADRKVSFIADAGTAKVDSLTVTKDSARADGKDADSVDVQVTDKNGNPVAGQAVALTASNGAVIAKAVTTDGNGRATATLTSRTAGASTVTATLGGSGKTATAHFVADTGTAQVKAVVLQGSEVSKVADGVSAFSYTVTVVDANGNPVPDQAVTASVNQAEHVKVSVSGKTGARGEATVTLTSTTAAVADVLVSAKLGDGAAVGADRKVSFIADAGTAKVDSLTVTKDSARADGKDADSVDVQVTDKNGNPVAGQAVALTASNGAVIAKAVTTDGNGRATATLTSRTAGASTVTATLGGSGKTATAHFVADASTAKVDSLTVTKDSARADGKDADSVDVQVTDKNGNPLAGQAVALTASNGAVIAKTVTTDGNGRATATLTSRTSGASTVTATLGGSGKTATAHFVADASTAKVDSLTVTKDSARADGKDADSVDVQVTDKNGNPLAGQAVALTASNGAVIAKTVTTDGNGRATATLTSRTAGASTVTATLGGSGKTATAHFVADASTAKVDSLTVTKDSARADGKDADSVDVQVTDKNGNPVAGQAVALTASNGAVIAKAVTTDGNGRATATLTSRTAGASTVTATLGGSGKTATAHFVADASTAKVDSLTVTKDSARADGKDADSVDVQVTDKNGNPLAGQAVALTASNGAVIAKTVTTDGNGRATATLTSRTSGASTVTATLGGSGKTATAHFVADASTAKVDSLTVTKDSARADGKDADSVDVQVTDKNGNPVAGQAVALTASNGAVIAKTVTTDGNGRATATLTSRTAGASTVTATLGGSGKTATAHFVADTGTAQVKAVVLQGSEVSKADGVSAFSYTVTVVDANGNLVPDQAVTASVNQAEHVKVSVSGKTGARGEATVTLTSTTAAVADVLVSAKLGDGAAVGADRKVSFIADTGTAQVKAVVLQGSEVSKVADGVSAFSYTVTVVDANGNPVPDQAVTASVNQAEHVKVSVSGKTGARGEATVTLTSTTAAVADVLVSAKLGDGAAVGADRKVSFIADAGTAKVDSLTVTKDSARADGKDADSVDVQVTDKNGNPLAGQAVALTASNGAVIAKAVTTDGNGRATATLTSRTAGASTVTATLGGSGKTATAHFVADASTAKVDSLTVTKDSARADGKDADSVDVQVTDKNGNPVAGQAVALTASNGAVIAKAVTTDGNGRATATLTSRTAGASTVTATLGGSGKTATAHFVADTGTAQVKAVVLQGSEVSKVADGVSAFSYTVTVVDANGNPVPDQAVTASVNQAEHVKVSVSGKTGARGEATVTLTSTTAAVADVLVSAKLGGGAAVGADRKVSFIADAGTAQVKAVVLQGSEVSKVADGVSAFSYTVTVVDANGNPVPDQAVTASVNQAEHVKVSVSGKTGARGEATVTLTSTTAAVADVLVSAKLGGGAAVGADRKVSFIADAGTAKVDSLTVTKDSARADGKDADSVDVQVTDKNGNPMAGQAVALTASNGAVIAKAVTTDGNGRATATLTSRTAGASTVTATLGGSGKTATAHFVADTGTAQVKAVVLQGSEVSKVADGVSAFSYTVTVVDANGNPVPDQAVTASVNQAEHVKVSVSGKTGARGEATVTLTSTTAAVADVLVSAKLGDGAAVGADRKVSFIADAGTAKVDSLTVTKDSARADGKDADSVDVQVTDKNGNPVAGQAVALTASNGAVIAKAVTTDGNGRATATLTSRTAGASTVTATLGGSGKTATAHFVADASTAKVDSLTVTKDSARADGKDADSVDVQVTDKNGNPVAGQAVALTASNGAVIAKAVTTDGNGRATATLTSRTAGASTVTATLGGSGKTATAHFVADASTAKVDSLTVTKDSARADGKDADSVDVQVTDKNGNPVAGQAVALTASNGAVIAKAVTTDGNGRATATLTSRTAGASTVTATLGGSGKTATAHFVADTGTAQVKAVVLQGSEVSKVADGVSAFSYTVTVVDANGNPVPDQAVTASVNQAEHVKVSVSGKTGARGEATVTLTSTTAAVADVLVSAKLGDGAAVGADRKVSFIADAGTAKVDSLTVTKDSARADGKDADSVDVQVTDKNGNPLAGQAVALTASNGAVIAKAVTTDGNGRATATLTSRTAGASTVTATLGGSGKTATAHFVADASTAKVDSLTVTKDSARADGKDADSVDVQVTDKNGNPVAGQAVALTASNGAVIAKTVTTDGNGRATATLTSRTSGASTVTATLGGSGKTATAHFVADASTAKVDSLTVTKDSARADGKDADSVDVQVTDKNGNPVAGQAVALTASNGAVIAKTVTTDGNGRATATLTSRTAGASTVTATLGGSGKTATAHFVADASTAKVDSLTVTKDSARADGKDADSVDVQVTDKNGNPVAGQAVALTASNGAVIAKTVTTDGNGRATATLTSRTAGASTVTATLGGSGKTATAHFVADTGTAQVKAVVLQGSEVSKVADGVSAFSYTVTVVDANGNPVPDQAVTASVNQAEHVKVSVSGKTGARGEATVTLTSTTAAVADVLVSAKLGDGAAVGADRKVSFIADTGTAQVKAVVLQGSEVSKVADGVSAFSYTVTVVDANGNPVPDQAVTASVNQAEHVKVSVSGKTGARGEATVTLTSTTAAVADVLVSAKLGDGAAVGADRKVSFIAGTPAQLRSSIAIDSANYISGDDMLITVTLRDVNGNPVSGMLDSLTAGAVKVANAMLKTSGWKDNGNGTYVTTYTAATAGSGLKATLKLDGWGRESLSRLYSITAGSVSPQMSSLTLSQTRIVANNNISGKDAATITLTLRDSFNNVISGQEKNLKFVPQSADVFKKGDVTITSVSESQDVKGQYTATIFGSQARRYNIRPTISDKYIGDLNVELSIFNYLFGFITPDKTIVQGGKYKFRVIATTSDTGAVENVTEKMTWVISNEKVATVSEDGTVEGISSGSTIIIALGVYNGIEFHVSGTLTVKGPTYSELYGAVAARDSESEYIIEPPSYSLAVRSGDIIDALGTKEHITGGTGGSAYTIDRLHELKSITVITGHFSGDENITIDGLVFTWKNGETSKYGSDKDGGSVKDTVRKVFDIPNGYVLQGVDVSGGGYIHSLRFITMPVDESE